MHKLTKLSVQWFYELLERGECSIMDFKEQLENKKNFGKSLKNFSHSYDELARDVVAFANFKGGFLFVGIVDNTKEFNPDFQYSDQKLNDLVKQIQDRTFPTITIRPHRLKLEEGEVLVLEVPFSTQMHRTSRGEYLIRSNDGNRSIEPYEMATIMAEKGMIVYDQKTWNISGEWIDSKRLSNLREMITAKNPDSPYIDKNDEDFLDSLCMTKEENGHIMPTTTGILFVGNDKALRELPYYQVKYIHYFADGTYKPYEYSGNIVEIARDCFAQLKAEIRQKEYIFGLFREYVEDYSEIVIRELLINALAHRDISRSQIVEVYKYDDGQYLEIESPGTFPDGITIHNYLRRTNPRNPNIMDILRVIGLAEKAGSGFDKIFTDLLKKGKSLPYPEETDSSVIFRIKANVETDKLIELSLLYEEKTGKPINLNSLLVLKELVKTRSIRKDQLVQRTHISEYRIGSILKELEELEFVEPSGKTSGTSYMLHISKRNTTKEKVEYVLSKKQEKARQKEAIRRYLDDVPTINNAEARTLLKLTQKDAPLVSKLFKSLLESGDIVIDSGEGGNKQCYRKS